MDVSEGHESLVPATCMLALAYTFQPMHVVHECDSCHQSPAKAFDQSFRWCKIQLCWLMFVSVQVHVPENGFITALFKYSYLICACMQR